jgi:hypothetical protein
MPEAPLKDVFISHSSADLDLVTKFADKLNSMGIATWFAPADMKPGTEAISTIEDGLKGSKAVVVFLSRTALASFWVNVELQIRINQIAHDRSLKLIPVLIGDVQRREIPETLQIFQGLDFNGTDWTSPLQFQARVDLLAQAVRDTVGRPGVALSPMPVVVFAMTATEADDLAKGRVFASGSPEADAFGRFLSSLEGYTTNNLTSFYGNSRDDWRPRFAQGVTIRQTVQSVVDRVNLDHGRNPNIPRVQVQFFSTDFFSDDVEWRRRTRSEVEDLGYVLIVDALSIFHPRLRRMLSGAGGREPASMVVACPTELDRSPNNQLLDQNFGPELDRAFIRFYERFDRRCEIGISYGINLKRWLYLTLPDAAQRIQEMTAHPQNLEAFRKQNEQQGVTTTGLGTLVTGRV